MKRMFGGSVEVLRAPLLDLALETPRLSLRCVGEGDVPALAEHLSDVEVTRWLARVPHPYAPSDAEAFVRHTGLAAVGGTAATLALVPRSGGPMVGIVAIHGLDGVPEFGYWLARSHWGRGLMTEAAGAMLGWIYGTLPVDRMVSGAFVGNEASLAIQKRFGFRRVGSSRRPCLARGGLYDHVDTELDRRRFRPA